MTYVCCLTKPEAEDTILNGDTPVLTMADLYALLVDKSVRDIKLNDDFIEQNFTDVGLEEFVTQAKLINEHLRFEFNDKYLSAHKSKVAELARLRTVEDVLNYFIIKKDLGIQLLRDACGAYDKNYMNSLSASNKLSSMHLECSKKDVEIESLKEEIQKILDSKHNIERKLETLVARIQYNYNKFIDTAAMNGVVIDSPHYKKILYIKEVTRVHYVDTFIYYLQEILRSLYNVPARLIVMEPYYAFSRSKFYPNCVPHDRLSKTDIFKEDIFMAGYQERIVKAVLKNPANVPYLIILDRTGWELPFVTGKQVEHLYTTSNVEDAEGAPTDRLISYSEATLNIPHIPNFDELSLESKISKYSSMDAMKVIIQLLES